MSTLKKNVTERNLQRLHEVHFSEHDIKNVFEQLDTTKAKRATGLDNVFLKGMANVFCTSLKIVFNTIANKHVFPHVWKTAEVVPIYKNGDKQDISNYRGINLLSCTSKVLEKLLFKKFNAVTKDVLSNDQHGFCQNRSATTQMIMFLNEIHSGLNNKTLSTLYLDFQKTFDVVCHEKLMEKFYYYGFSGVV